MLSSPPTFNNRPNKVHKIVEEQSTRSVWESRSIAVATIQCIAVPTSNKPLCYFAIGQRSEKMDNPGKWCLPCGYLDWDETLAQAAERELYEEIGLQPVNPLSFWKVTDNMDSPKQNVTIYYASWAAQNSLPVLTPDLNECVDAKWVHINELDAYEFAWSHKQRIKQYHQQLVFY